MNKFNIHWQIVRVNARKLKDVGEKIDYVKRFIVKHPNIFNFDRVMNWAKMTKVAYPKHSIQQSLFTNFIHQLEQYQEDYEDPNDMDNDLTKISIENLKLVYDDLKKRKYGFQFKTAPKDHIEFMKELKDELNSRSTGSSFT
jgi:hypothetical protein